MNTAEKIVELVTDRSCTKCGVIHPSTEFHHRNKQCRSCLYKKGNEYRLKNMERYRLYAKKHRLKAKGMFGEVENISNNIKQLPNTPKGRLVTDEHQRLNRQGLKLKKYGITVADAEKMLEHQMGLCANRGCGDEISLSGKNGKRATAHVDHDHKNGMVRGLLCMGCNIGLGMLKENKNKIFGLTEYLNKFDIK